MLLPLNSPTFHKHLETIRYHSKSFANRLSTMTFKAVEVQLDAHGVIINIIFAVPHEFHRGDFVMIFISDGLFDETHDMDSEMDLYFDGWYNTMKAVPEHHKFLRFND